MQNPALELGADIGTVLVKNLIRSFGEADSDTISEQLRDLVNRHPHGPAIFTVSLAAVAYGFHRHILH